MLRTRPTGNTRSMVTTLGQMNGDVERSAELRRDAPGFEQTREAQEAFASLRR
jgi:hypothetical protein